VVTRIRDGNADTLVDTGDVATVFLVTRRRGKTCGNIALLVVS